MKKVVFLIFLSLVFSQPAIAAISANIDESATTSQNACVIDVSLSYPIDQGYDPDSAEAELTSTEASYSNKIALDNDKNYAYGGVTVNAILPTTTKLFSFTSKFYMRKNGATSKTLILTESSSVACENPSYTKQKLAQNTTKLPNQQTYSATPQNGGSSVQYGNKSFNISGIGAALSGCLGAGKWVTGALGSIFGGGGGSDSVAVDDSEANQKESCGDALAYAASRVIIQNMSKSIVNWATTGNNGNPYYPTNYQSLYQNIRNTEIRSFVSELQSNANKNPYNTSFAKSLAAKAREDSKSFAERNAYTGPGPEFFQDFRNGGWDAWFNYILIPKNNPLGYSQIASEENAKRQNTAVESTQEELKNNNGFLSQKTCDDKNYVPWKDSAEEAKVTAAASSGDENAIKRVLQSTCSNFKIQTPGSLISKQLSDILGSPIRQAEQVDEVDEALGAVFDNIISSLVTKGLTGLSSNNFKQTVDFSYNAPGSQNPGYNLPTGGTFWDQYNTNFDLRRDIPGIIATQEAYLKQIRKNNQALTLVLKSIDLMDYELPGPRIGWAEGIPQKIQIKVQEIKHQAKIYQGGIVGNLLTLGVRDKVLDGIESAFLQIFNEIFEQYQTDIANRFDPNYNIKMPSKSFEMIARIQTRSTYEEKLSKNASEINGMETIILQLKNIRFQVDALYKRACERFKKDNPGAECI